ncbi:hypothetical protein VE25_01790 [Devosia geojensis]|uniref:Uncharacterized protein n=1 Tax=Devosia geojensis TaxID=443610 RepID=A0A0F5FXA3_9HYPH|nr:hypothetical protein VE25_01790 [Devosia geojensis]
MAPEQPRQMKAAQLSKIGEFPECYISLGMRRKKVSRESQCRGGVRFGRRSDIVRRCPLSQYPDQFLKKSRHLERGALPHERLVHPRKMRSERAAGQEVISQDDFSGSSSLTG